MRDTVTLLWSLAAVAFVLCLLSWLAIFTDAGSTVTAIVAIAFVSVTLTLAAVVAFDYLRGR